MRLAVLVVGMLVAIWIYVDALRMIATGRPERIDLGGGGVLSALVCALAALLVFPRPLGAMMLFGLAALASLVVATQGYTEKHRQAPTWSLIRRLFCVRNGLSVPESLPYNAGVFPPGDIFTRQTPEPHAGRLSVYARA